MNFYSNVIQDISKIRKFTDIAQTGTIVADKIMFIDAINELEQTIKNIKDKCNAENENSI